MQESTDIYKEMNERILGLLADAKDPEYIVYLKNFQKRVIQQKYQADLLKEELEKSYVLYVNRMRSRQIDSIQQPAPMTSPAPMGKPAPMAGPVPMDNLTPMAGPILTTSSVEQVPKEKKKSAEFVFGATILSTVGALFIFAALVTLGITFMGDLFKGIALLVFSLLLVVLAETLLVKRIPKFGTIISAIGLGATYIFTIVNYDVWHNFNLWESLGIVLAVSAATVAISCRRRNIFYREFAMAAGFISFLTMDYTITDGEFLVTIGLFFLLHVICLWRVEPEKKNIVSIVHTAGNVLFTFIFFLRSFYGTGIGEGALIIFLLCSVGIQQIILVGNVGVSHRKSTWILYDIADIIYMMLFPIAVKGGIEAAGSNWYCYGTAIGLGIILSAAGVLLAVCHAKQDLEHLYVCGNALLLVVLSCTHQIWVPTAALVTAILVAKLFSLKKSQLLHVNDFFLTAVACIALGYLETPYLYLALITLVLDVLFLHFFQTGFQCLIGATIVFLCCRFLTGGLRMIAVMGVLFLSMLLFGNIERYKGKYQMVYFVSALIVQGICCLGLINPKYQNAYLIYLCLLVFGVATIVFVVQDKNHFSSRVKYIMLFGFLTYMALAFQSNVPFVNSILLMVIALTGVGIGFARERKPIRVYGLILALLVCAKLVLYDFLRAPTLQKTVLFLLVGVIALAISAVYIVLEKKNHR